MTPNNTSPQPKAPPRFQEDNLKDYWDRLFKNRPPKIDCHPLPGDASTRQYFRVRPDAPTASNDPDSLILMQLEQPVEGEDIDFTRILRFLEDLSLPVPKLYTYDGERGILLLEDCGDETLETQLMKSDPDAIRNWYHKSVELLADMQIRATQIIGPDCPAFHLRFNTKKLMWEMDFMLEHFADGLLEFSWRDGQREALRTALLRLCEELDREPVSFTHRDYHCRNLMVQDDKLVLIDFQDARLGPAQYDLVSLLRDSYYRVPEDMVWEMVDLFIELKNQQTEEPLDREHFIHIFDLMAVQRNLKAVGTFAYQTHKMNNDRYRAYIEPTLAMVRDTFSRRSEFTDLQQQLGKVIPQLRP